MEKKNDLLKSLPKVDESILMLRQILGDSIPSILLKKVVRQCIEEERSLILKNNVNEKKDNTEWRAKFLAMAEDEMSPNLKRVINGSGIVIHTNLGRSLLHEQAIEQIASCSKGYSNLEFDLLQGKRGSRYSLVEDIICDLTGAEAALVVNNNAAAVLLALDTLAKGKEAIVSRGELVEIGGSFRIPEVMEKSGARLVEVGATNRTHYRDYENALTDETALLLKVHTSNFRMVGFTKEVSTEELVRLAAEKGLKVMEDLGSGCLVDMSQFGLPRERMVQEVVAAGADVVTFSGDKLLGGPQAGIIIGRKAVIDKIKTNPLNRALRIDKLTLAALESTLRLYYDNDSVINKIPTLAMLSESQKNIKKRAQKLYRKLGKKESLRCDVKIVSTVSQTGGGAMPEYGLQSWALRIIPHDIPVHRFEEDMRAGQVPLLGRIEDGGFLIDLRTVLDGDIDEIALLLAGYFA